MAVFGRLMSKGSQLDSITMLVIMPDTFVDGISSTVGGAKMSSSTVALLRKR